MALRGPGRALVLPGEANCKLPRSARWPRRPGARPGLRALADGGLQRGTAELAGLASTAGPFAFLPFVFNSQGLRGLSLKGKVMEERSLAEHSGGAGEGFWENARSWRASAWKARSPCPYAVGRAVPTRGLKSASCGELCDALMQALRNAKPRSPLLLALLFACEAGVDRRAELCLWPSKYVPRSESKSFFRLPPSSLLPLRLPSNARPPLEYGVREASALLALTQRSAAQRRCWRKFGGGL